MAMLTDIQLKAARFIHRHTQDNGIPPSLREITKYFGWKAVGSAQAVISALRKKGILASNSPGKARQLKLTPLGYEVLGIQKDLPQNAVAADDRVVWVPVLGHVAAGHPTEAHEPPERSFPFPREAFRSNRHEEYFCLTVDGFSMINAGLLPGDQVLVERGNEARNGDIVVAMTNPGEVTIKRLAVRGSDLYRQALDGLSDERRRAPALLVPENPVFEPIPFQGDEHCAILGIVRSLFRSEVH